MATSAAGAFHVLLLSATKLQAEAHLVTLAIPLWRCRAVLYDHRVRGHQP
jgi:hypothetical protein